MATWFSDSHVIITGGNFQNQTSNFTAEKRGFDGFERLQRKAALAAMHNSGESFKKPKCHENTRVAVLRRLMDWILGKIERDKSVMWLFGDAGSGKSAIAQTLATQCSSAGHLLASFAFSRNDNSCSNHTSLASTIAYQMSTLVPELRLFIDDAVQLDPRIFEKSLEAQFKSLIVNPINGLSDRPEFAPNPVPHLVIIDGLDECSDRQVQTLILEVLFETVKWSNVQLKVLVVSRPEVNISSAFNHDFIGSLSTRLALDASFKPDDDIRLVLGTIFRSIKAKHPSTRSIPADWPTRDIMTRLVVNASGQFIYASTVGNYISSSRHHPVERLEIVLGLRPPASDQDLPFAALDSLFTHIFSCIPDEYIKAVLDILGFQMYAPQTSSFDPMFSLLSLDEHKMDLYLGDLSSILKWETSRSYGSYHEMNFTHSSVTDFLSNCQRSRKFYIDKKLFLSRLACMCLGHLNQDLSDLNSVLDHTQMYCVDHLHILLENYWTPELRNRLLIFSLPKVQENMEFRGIVKFMHTLRRKEDNQDIYAHHLHDFDRCILSIMKEEQMCPNKGQALQIALIGLSHNVPPRARMSRTRSRTRSRIDKNQNFDIFGNGFFSFQEEEEELVDFFDNPLRSQEFFRSGATYAAAALAAFHGIFSEFSLHKYMVVPTSHAVARSGIMHAIAVINFFNTACHYLPQLLNRASYSPELIVFIQSGKFQNTYGKKIFPLHHARVTRDYNRAVIAQVVQACEAYVTHVVPAVNQHNQTQEVFQPSHRDDLPECVGLIERRKYQDLPKGVFAEFLTKIL